MTTTDRRTLQYTEPEHMTGPDVKALQLRLNRVGPTYAFLEVDEDFGVVTELVVREFQRRARLRVDGTVGPLTLAALGLT